MNRKVEITVGLFMVIAICSILFLCFKVTDASSFTHKSTYRVYAVFDNVGGLKARSPIKIGGVVIGRISNISLNNYKPYVTMDIDGRYNQIPSSSSLSIKTSGLLGEQFVDVSLGIEKSFESELDDLDAQDRGVADDPSVNHENQIPDYFEEGFVVHNTIPAVVIEDLIGKFLYSNDASKDSQSNKKEQTSK
ncbi:outer membrane lipid asymmetry maintenance protein MlaD [Orbus sasakiae]|uniref:Outer membrane lipid asymmetry maintenance protein MlaD n=1 Tax=Orbus sasakiae TaxID=1078475 RepID=A0ABP9NCB1_9GAMM